MTERNEGTTCPLEKGDLVRIIKARMLDYMDIVTTVAEVHPPGVRATNGPNRVFITGEVSYETAEPFNTLFPRGALYKLPPDFRQVTNLEAAQRIKKLLLTHTED